tara:strand:- start:3401 stop:3661 length:261 start_codon:yes stop_codon:yes gene_type:complete
MLKVTLLDKETGEEKVYPSTSISVFQWTENNWSCDCNREIAFLKEGEDLGLEKPCTSSRYIVVDAEGDLEGYTKEIFIEECNKEYL